MRVDPSDTEAMEAAGALLTDLTPLLSANTLDPKLMRIAILNHGTPRGLAEFAQQGKDKEALVENNYDFAAKKDAPDHLELLVTNNSAVEVKDFSLYLTVKDADTGATESYFKPLPGFSVPANGEARVHLDDAAIAGHFRDNPNGIYHTTQTAKVITFELAAAGFPKGAPAPGCTYPSARRWPLARRRNGWCRTLQRQRSSSCSPGPCRRIRPSARRR